MPQVEVANFPYQLLAWREASQSVRLDREEKRYGVRLCGAATANVQGGCLLIKRLLESTL
jgi:hypothetical protein